MQGGRGKKVKSKIQQNYNKVTIYVYRRTETLRLGTLFCRGTLRHNMVLTPPKIP